MHMTATPRESIVIARSASDEAIQDSGKEGTGSLPRSLSSGAPSHDPLARDNGSLASGAPSGEAAVIAPSADPGFLQRHGATIEYIQIPGAALVGALVVFGIFVALFGKNPLDLYFNMYQGAFGTWFSWQNTLTRAAPLILTALCAALPAQLGLVIIGGEGALLIGALSASSMALALPFAPPLVVHFGGAGAGGAGGGGGGRRAGARRRGRGGN